MVADNPTLYVGPLCSARPLHMLMMSSCSLASLASHVKWTVSSSGTSTNVSNTAGPRMTPCGCRDLKKDSAWCLPHRDANDWADPPASSASPCPPGSDACSPQGDHTSLSFPHRWYGLWCSKIEMPNLKLLRHSKLGKSEESAKLTQTDLREPRSALLRSAPVVPLLQAHLLPIPSRGVGGKWPHICCFRVFLKSTFFFIAKTSACFQLSGAARPPHGFSITHTMLAELRL